MKQKLLFTTQVFSVLLVILWVFVGSLKRDLNKERISREEHAAIRQQETGKDSPSGFFFSPFVISLPDFAGSN